MPQRLGAFPQINWGHPLAQTLLACVVPEAELLTGTPPTTVDTHGVLAPGQWGPGIKSDQGGGANTGGVKFVLPAWSKLYGLGNVFTAVLVARVSTIGNSYRALVSVPYDSGGNNPYYAFSTHNAYGDTSQGCWFSFGGSISYYTGLSGWFLQDGAVHVYVVVYNNGALTFYRDGVVYATDTMTGGTPDVAVNKQPLWFGCANNVGLGQLAVDQTAFLYTVHNRVLSAAEVLAFSADPFAVITEDADPMLLAGFGGGPTSYTLTAAPGAFALTGQTAALRAQRQLAAATGVFTETGQAAALSLFRRLTAAVGTLTLSGQTVRLAAQRRLAAAPGAFTLSGQDVALSVNGARTLAASPGVFTLAGQAAVLRAQRRMAAAPGAFALTGQPAALRAQRQLAAGTGTLVLSGQPAALRAAHRLAAGAGIFALAGQTAALVRGRIMQVSAGIFSLSGQAAAFNVARRLVAGTGLFSLVGVAASLISSTTGGPMYCVLTIEELAEMGCVLEVEEAADMYVVLTVERV